MTIRVAAIGVSHWHALNDAAYLRHLIAMPDVELVAVQDSDAGACRQARGRSGQPADLDTDYYAMLKATRPDFVVASGGTARWPTIAAAICSMPAVRS